MVHVYLVSGMYGGNPWSGIDAHVGHDRYIGYEYV